MEEVRFDATRYSDGSTGEYRPQPLDYEVPRLKGAGTAGIAGAPLMDRREHLEAVRRGELGSIHSWELVTAVDGPGTRMTIFLAGCPLRCLYCHNPDTFKMKDGEPVRAEDLLSRISRYVPIFRSSGGGITISGGEPLMQPQFVAWLLRGAKDMGVHTCIDTSGFLGRNLTDEMMADLDLVLLDVKSGIPETYRRTTGRDLQPTIDFGDRLNAAGKKIWIRFVVVPGLTDAPENVEAVANIVSRWENVQRVEVLPFHQMGRDKWRELGYEYQLEDVQPPSKESVESIRQVFRSRGIETY
ncbi:pyruvate formate-lyase 1-activating enzyme [Boudabousia liubingyangii]|uniref:Pyruvate formate-lyase-activating enzyme n=1 Tax=Boudabousia liubingyangii TaxID=1921764 RepID=A0A1Q5PJC5_9ACTO|nr:pyruvate formate-lyase-activating protein [Boudabousia liubingyangii]OKL45993.1 pyruvate formate-lyase 1-activating enzyme [Boudabousia liubingyangii]OKL47730.1 pyruvate formate-lyase 1-activating enzyme [Boudabousia liubingyangii]